MALRQLKLNDPSDLKTTTPTWKITLPTDKPCQIYPRVSTVGQVGNVSSEMQQDKAFAVQCGWEEDLIVVDDRDLGVSGQTRMEDRIAFHEMNRRIQRGDIKAVVTVQVDRLFRDRWGVEYSKFMELCERTGVLVVTPDFVYDFSVEWHVDRFCRQCEEAWQYIEYHIKGRLRAAIDRLATQGYVTGGNLPIGYVIDAGEKRRKYIPYEPQVPKILELFKMFRETGGVTSEVLRQITQREFLFPSFKEPYDTLTTRYRMTEVHRGSEMIGYRPMHVTTVRHILTNPVYIGHFVWGGVVVGWNTHKAIVPEDLFFYAFNTLSPTLLNGEPNPNYDRAQYHTKRKSDCSLACVLETDNKDERIYGTMVYNSGREPYPVYRVYKDGDENQLSLKYTLRADHVDDSVFTHLFARLQEAGQYKDYAAYDESEKVDDERKAQIEGDIQAMKNALKTNREKVLSLTNLTLLKDLEDQAIAFEAELRRLEGQLAGTQKMANLKEKRLECIELAVVLGDRWREVMDETDKIDTVDLFIDKIVVTVKSPKVYTLTIHWSIFGADEIVLIREEPGSFCWSPEEGAILQQVYPTESFWNILAALPDRTWDSIRIKACTFGLHRKREKGREKFPKQFSHNDIKALEQYGVDWQSVGKGIWRVYVTNFHR